MPTHDHKDNMILDDDSALFTINPVTRRIEYNSIDGLVMIQNDRNSERLSFEVPKIVEGHNMLECDIVEVHFINEGTIGNLEKQIYRVSDLAEDPSNSEMLRFTWLVSSNATKYAGKTRFAVRFICTDKTEQANFIYEWATYPCDVIIVGESIYNTEYANETVVNDILAGWKEQLMVDFEWLPNETDGSKTVLAVSSLYTNQTRSDDLKGASNYQVWLDAGNTGTEADFFATLKGEKGDKGEQGPIGVTPEFKVGTVTTVNHDNPLPKIEVTGEKNNPVLNFVLPEPDRDYITDIDGNQMYFFTGTKEEYDALPEEQKTNIFALITDDDGIDKYITEKLDSTINKTVNELTAKTDETLEVAQTYINVTKYLVERLAGDQTSTHTVTYDLELNSFCAEPEGQEIIIFLDQNYTIHPWLYKLTSVTHNCDLIEQPSIVIQNNGLPNTSCKHYISIRMLHYQNWIMPKITCTFTLMRGVDDYS